MEGKQLFSLFIVLIMAASIFGLSVFYSFPDQEGNGSNEPPPLDVPPTEMMFSAESVPATVVQILPSMKISAETGSGDIVQVNNTIYAIEGVKRLNGRFQPATGTMLGTGFVYIADISFDRDLNAQHIIQKLEETGLQNIDGFSFALIALPKKVQVYNADANISRDLNLSENVSEALVGFESIADDNLEIALQATFLGSQLTNLLAFETLNITAEPVPKQADLPAPIASLEETLLFTSTVSFTQLDSLQDLNQQLLAIPSVTDTQVFLPAIDPALFISSGEEILEENFSDLNTFLHELEAERVNLLNQPLYASLYFPEIAGISLASKQAVIQEKLNQLSIDANVTQSTGILSGQLSLSTPDSAEAAAGLEALLPEAEIQQPGQLSLQQVFDPGLDIMHQVPSGKVDALLQPGHALEEEVPVQLNYALVRGEIGFASAAEN